MVWASHPGLGLTVLDDAVTLTLQSEMLWQVGIDSETVSPEGVFFTDQGMVAVTPWGFVGWTPDEAARVIEDALAGLGSDMSELSVGSLRTPAPTRPLH